MNYSVYGIWVQKGSLILAVICLVWLYNAETVVLRVLEE